MNEDVAIIEGIYDIVLPEVPASLHRWGRKVCKHIQEPIDYEIYTVIVCKLVYQDSRRDYLAGYIS